MVSSSIFFAFLA